MASPEYPVKAYFVTAFNEGWMTNARRAAECRVHDIAETFVTDVQRTRVFGFFLDQAKAIEAVEANFGDLYEAGYYTWIVIDCQHEGIHGLGGLEVDPIWFHWEGQRSGKWVRVETPEWSKYYVNFSIG